jgi:hypothetical protein
MGGYLDQYGAGEERREKIVRNLVLGALAAVILGVVLYFTFRNYRETRQAERFLDLLRKQEYATAYRMWGCTEDRPCRDYRFERFMEDWGPEAGHGDPAATRVAKTRSCASGVIYTIEFAKGEPVLLWVERRDRLLSFAPWPVCNPRMAAPAPGG